MPNVMKLSLANHLVYDVVKYDMKELNRYITPSILKILR